MEPFFFFFFPFGLLYINVSQKNEALKKVSKHIYETTEEGWDRKICFGVVWQCFTSSFDRQDIWKRKTNQILFDTFFSVRTGKKKTHKKHQPKNRIIEAYSSICKYFLFVQLRKVGVLSESAYGREPFEKVLRNNFHFFTIKLHFLKNLFKGW